MNFRIIFTHILAKNRFIFKNLPYFNLKMVIRLQLYVIIGIALSQSYFKDQHEFKG